MPSIQMRQYIPEAFCLSCKGCCTFAEKDSIWAPVLLREEMKELVCDDKVPPMAIARDNTLRLREAPKTGAYECPLFDAAHARCSIYAVRPFECRLYPFLIHRKGKNIFLALHTRCRFLSSRGAESGFKDYGAYMLDFFKTQGLALIKDNPHLAREYPQEEIVIVAPVQ